MSATACVSARSDFRNFSRAGVAKKRSRTSTVVPGGCAAGSTAPRSPASQASFAAASPLREVIVSRDTEPMEGSASPRKPKE